MSGQEALGGKIYENKTSRSKESNALSHAWCIERSRR